MIWFSSDWHLGHNNVIKPDFCNRPYDNIEAMSESIITNWNANVKPEDDGYLLGDIIWKKANVNLLNSLNGHLHLIIGNHDHDFVVKHPRWESTQDGKRIKYEGHTFVLYHYPIESWYKQDHGYIHLHGHTHSGLSHQISTISRRYDVGVDSWNMHPVSAETLIKKSCA